MITDNLCDLLYALATVGALVGLALLVFAPLPPVVGVALFGIGIAAIMLLP